VVDTSPVGRQSTALVGLRTRPKDPVGKPFGRPEPDTVEARMDKGVCKIVGSLMLGASAICLYVAYDYYQENERAFRYLQSSGMGNMRGRTITPVTPRASRVAFLVGVLFGVGGGLFLAKGRTREGSAPLDRGETARPPWSRRSRSSVRRGPRLPRGDDPSHPR
jgi:hypothetical protein